MALEGSSLSWLCKLEGWWFIENIRLQSSTNSSLQQQGLARPTLPFSLQAAELMETSQSSYLREGRPEDLFGLPDPLVLEPATGARLAPGSTSSTLMPSAPTWQRISSKADFKRKKLSKHHTGASPGARWCQRSQCGWWQPSPQTPHHPVIETP